ncbi:MAG: hypothetical protein JKY04_00545, partial [Sneathiella sp.]|nr:hypothetical protein [Sneathiella sp.]
MLKFWRASLVGRLILLAAMVFAVSIPLFFVLFSASVNRISTGVVDTRMIEFAGQVRGFWASEQATALTTETDTEIDVSTTGLGGPDIEWVWQITVEGAATRRSELLQLVDATIPASVTNPTPDFVLGTRTTPLGTLRIAERIIEEPVIGGLNRTQRVHYL